MLYTSDEISKIHMLAQHADLNNVLLAFELINGRGMTNELVDDIYWIYNRLIWADENQLAKKVIRLFKTYWTKQFSDFPEFNEHVLYLDAPIEAHATLLNLDFQLLCQRIYVQFPTPNQDFIIRFLFKYGSPDIQKEMLPLLKSREHTGRFLLNLGGLNLKSIPEIILQEKQVQILKIWGNDLKTLPDFWDHFRFLEVLNIAENNLAELPPSFTTLQRLQRLYAQNNQFNVSPLLQQIKQLGRLNYLTITNPKDTLSNYTYAEHELLKEIEELVNHEKIHASQKEQNIFLALWMNKDTALQQLSIIDLFEALSNHNKLIQQRAKEKILNWKGAVFKGQIPSNASIAILGFVSFATRNRITKLERQGIKFTTELTSNTTHIVLGDQPEVSQLLEEKPFVFMTESDLDQDLILRY
ncbi:hypothetical protein [Aureispira sp. CCB-E]|uniref:hypothetical protein n=1 Tax=Aureispira sp. CCB-E TaxID=3051121 RepID=UPI0028690575|nr:hypothetical protein [Aureispira sp. CCB-E]WMX14671.1 hypothetical protein QP953_27815 [Aureispira sp. CCB-E]